MSIHPSSRRMLIAYATFHLAVVAVTIRAVFTQGREADFGLMVALLVVYMALLAAEPFILARRPVLLHGFNALQTAIGLFLLLTVGRFDYFSLLFIPPSALSVLYLPTRQAAAWIGGIIVLMSGALLAHFPREEGISYVITYTAGIFFFASLSYLARQAEEAQARSEALLADLQEANRRLKEYAAQVQVLAAAEERNRLARELHDSVTQIIFGLTLSAQAARILFDRDPSRVAPQLDHMQVLAQNALSEMRALIQQLHPRTAAEEGLTSALRRLAAERQAADGLHVSLTIHGERRLPVKTEEELFRVTQEALNNVAKHARTSRAAVTLDLRDAERVVLCIEDDGAGFDVAQARELAGHLGLTSMAERVEALGGSLAIDSQPGRGTRLRVEVVAPAAAVNEEVAHAGS